MDQTNQIVVFPGTETTNQQMHVRYACIPLGSQKDPYPVVAATGPPRCIYDIVQDYDPLRTINRSHRGWHYTLVFVSQFDNYLTNGHYSMVCQHEQRTPAFGIDQNYILPVVRYRTF